MVSGRFGDAFPHYLIQFAMKGSINRVARSFKVLQFFAVLRVGGVSFRICFFPLLQFLHHAEGPKGEV